MSKPLSKAERSFKVKVDEMTRRTQEVERHMRKIEKVVKGLPADKQKRN